MIVLEGPDATGKTTLAKYLANALNVPVQHSEGPQQYEGEMANRLERYAALPPSTIFDRHPCVSDIIYAYAFGRKVHVPTKAVVDFYARKPLLIYCAPSSRIVTHEVKAHDTPEHLASLLENEHRIHEAYLRWAQHHANIIYRIGDSPSRILHFVNDFTGDIRDFHEKFGLSYQGQPRYLPPELYQFRVGFMAEELCEYAGLDKLTTQLVLSAFKEKAYHPSLHDEFDALVDLVYVALGTAYLQGFRFTEGWANVHRANMAKRRALHMNESKRSSTNDVIKPEGWQAPDLGYLLVHERLAP